MKGILCLNAGSSSLKFALIDTKGNELLSGSIEHIPEKTSTLLFEGKRSISCANHKQAFFKILELLKKKKVEILATSHRIVHGLDLFHRPVILTTKIVQTLSKHVDLAPLHLPNELLVATSCMQTMKRIKHVACFDTSFFADLPLVTQTLPLGKTAKKFPIQRFGFHGISYEFLTTQIPKEKKAVIAHLGHGSSLAAVYKAKPLDTTMSFSPTSGVMMSSRTGDLDPSIILYLLKQKMSPEKLQSFCNFESGLLGVSEKTADMKALLNIQTKKAKLAIDMYSLNVAKAIASLAVSLKKIDLLVFSAGIGERSPIIRKKIIEHLSFLGAAIDAKKNQKNSQTISSKHSRVVIQVIPTNENYQMAKHVTTLFKGKL